MPLPSRLSTTSADLVPNSRPIMMSSTASRFQGSVLPDPCFWPALDEPGFSGTQGGHQILNNIVQDNISGIELDSNCPSSNWCSSI